MRVRVVKHTITSLGSTYGSQRPTKASPKNCQISIWKRFKASFLRENSKMVVCQSCVRTVTDLHKRRSGHQVRRSHNHTGVQIIIGTSWGKQDRTSFSSQVCKVCTFSDWCFRFVYSRTLESHVSHMQDGSQKLGNLPGFRLGEHENLHGWQDAGIITQVVTTVTLCAATLWYKRNPSSGLLFMSRTRPAAPGNCNVA